MRDATRDVVRNAAAPPCRTPNFEELWRRGRRRRRRVRVASAATGLAVVALVVVVAASVLRAGDDGSSVVFQPAGPPASTPGSDDASGDQVVQLESAEFEVLAAASTGDASLKGHVVRDSRGLAAVWRMADVSGEPPVLPPKAVGVFVITRDTWSTCRSVDDVVGVEITGGVVVVQLDRNGAFRQPCPGPPGAGGWTAFAVAIPDTYDNGHGLTGARARLAPRGEHRRASEAPAHGTVDAVELIGMWAVRAAADDAPAMLRLDRHSGAWDLALLRECGVLYGGWDADGHGLFIADASAGGSGWVASHGCKDEAVAPQWLHSAVAHRTDGHGHALLDESGAVVARLVPGDVPDFRTSAPNDIVEPPEVTERARKALAPSAPLPAGLTPATEQALQGRWAPLDRADSSNAYADFDAHGSWAGSDGCNRLSGRWRAGSGGAFLATGGPSTLIGCDNVPVQERLTSASRAGFDGDVLVLVNRRGKVEGRFKRL